MGKDPRLNFGFSFCLIVWFGSGTLMVLGGERYGPCEYQGGTGLTKEQQFWLRECIDNAWGKFHCQSVHGIEL
jgi:hypothetical protein